MAFCASWHKAVNLRAIGKGYGCTPRPRKVTFLGDRSRRWKGRRLQGILLPMMDDNLPQIGLRDHRCFLGVPLNKNVEFWRG